jgi:hypothetical protein
MMTLVRSLAAWVVVFGLWLSTDNAAEAQNLANPYSGPAYTRPAVSPYLNLGLTANGLVNYQTLVKPMLDEQTALSLQAADVAQLQRQARRGPNAQDSNAPDPYSRTRSVRFMNYSHFYGNAIR